MMSSHYFGLLHSLCRRSKASHGLLSILRVVGRSSGDYTMVFRKRSYIGSMSFGLTRIIDNSSHHGRHTLRPMCVFALPGSKLIVHVLLIPALPFLKGVSHILMYIEYKYLSYKEYMIKIIKSSEAEGNNSCFSPDISQSASFVSIRGASYLREARA